MLPWVSTKNNHNYSAIFFCQNPKKSVPARLRNSCWGRILVQVTIYRRLLIGRPIRSLRYIVTCTRIRALVSNLYHPGAGPYITHKARKLYGFNPHSAGTVFIRQNLTTKVVPRTLRVNIFIMVVDP